jgi:hypothetical protein
MPSTPASAAIVVDQPSALIDVPVKIELGGFPAGQPVTITAALKFADASEWQSRATLITDSSGHVDLTRQAPISGTYDGVAPMGLIWSAERLPGEWLPLPPGSVMQPWSVHLDATAPDGTRAQATLERKGGGPGGERGGSRACHHPRGANARTDLARLGDRRSDVGISRAGRHRGPPSRDTWPCISVPVPQVRRRRAPHLRALRTDHGACHQPLRAGRE